MLPCLRTYKSMYCWDITMIHLNNRQSLALILKLPGAILCPPLYHHISVSNVRLIISYENSCYDKLYPIPVQAWTMCTMCTLIAEVSMHSVCMHSLFKIMGHVYTFCTLYTSDWVLIKLSAVRRKCWAKLRLSERALSPQTVKH